MTPPSSEFIPLRSSSPVLYPSHPLPPHFTPLLEESAGEEGGRGRSWQG